MGVLTIYTGDLPQLVIEIKVKGSNKIKFVRYGKGKLSPKVQIKNFIEEEKKG